MNNKLSRVLVSSCLACLAAGAFSAFAQQPELNAPVVRAPNPGQAPASAQAAPSVDTLPNPYAAQPQAAAPQAQIPQVPAVVPQPQVQMQPPSAQQAPVAPPAALPPIPPYQQFVDHNFPASHQQIQDLRRTVTGYQEVVAKPVAPPKPQTGSITVSLSPGSAPQRIRTYFGNTSSIVVVDSSGAPWPVENYRLGNSAAFQLNRMDGGQGSSFALDANMPFAQSNLLLQLAGSKAPIVLEVVAGQPEYDARLEIRVQGRGPNATAPASTTLPAALDGRMLSILDGVAPTGSKLLDVSYAGAQAWMLPSGRMVVRTPLKIVSPAPTSFVSSADGTHVYEFVPTSELLGMINGDFVNISIKGW